MAETFKNQNDTIVALATPRGRGALAIVRLTGESAIEIAASIVRDSLKFKRQAPHRLYTVDILDDNGNPLDRALCSVFEEPHSYTGENAVEFFVHCSPYIISKTVERCCQQGARIAHPGEFTQRAFLNGRMDLPQAEAVVDLIAAESAASHRVAMLQREGALSRKIQQLRDRITEICALIECEIDFSDQDLPVVESGELLERLGAVEKGLKDLEDSFAVGRLAREGAMVVIAGAPNVGKSTLFNTLIKEDRAIVHEEPGTTRDAVEGIVEWGGVTIRLADTAGQADDFSGPDDVAVARARQTSQGADLVLWVIDLTEQTPVLPPDTLRQQSLLIANKADLVDVGKVSLINEYIAVSALEEWGMERIQEAVLNRLLPEDRVEHAEGILTKERHLDAVRNALNSVEDGRQALIEGRGYELLADDLREALNRLGDVIGQVTPDDILNRIFADFCIGK